MVYILSSHPIWVFFYECGIPDEIISIIFSYKTYYSPLKIPYIELRETLDIQPLYKKNYLLSKDIFDSLYMLLFNSSIYNSYKRQIISDFIIKNRILYNKDKQFIFNRLLIKIKQHQKKLDTLCDNYTQNEDNQLRLILFKESITLNSIANDTAMTMLKYLIVMKFRSRLCTLFRKSKRRYK